MKLTKKEIRFSHSIRPAVDDVVEFDPVIILVKDVVIADNRKFLEHSMTRGAKCKILRNNEFTVNIHFVDDRDENRYFIVSPAYLVKRDLTDEAIEMIEKLKAKLNIGD